MHRFYVLLTLLLCSAVQGFAQLTTTNLPIIYVTTAGSLAIGDTQVSATLKIINNGAALNHPADAPQFNGNIGVKLRGNPAYAKKSYTIETWTTFKNEIDTPLLGMPSENDWVLMAAYPDRSLMRSLLVYQLYDDMGHYAPRMKFCEVFINGTYQGVYLFGETIKRNGSRISINKLSNSDNSGDAVTGGYIYEIDESGDAFWTSSYTPPFRSSGQSIKFHYQYPADNKITGVQKAYIKGYTDSFENAMAATAFQDTSLGWRAFAASSNFEDFHIINEASGNEEAYRLHTYLYKDRLKKMRPASPWETDVAFNNTASCNGSKDTAWMWRHAQYCPTDSFLPSFWWYRLQNDTQFVKDVKCRYTELRNTLLDTAHVFARIDSMATYLSAQGALTRNFALWNIWSTPIVNEPQPMTQNFAQEVLRIKTYYKKRLLFLDSKWLRNCAPLASGQFAGNVRVATVFPNPADDNCTVRFSLENAGTIALQLHNMLGQKVYERRIQYNSGTHNAPLSLQGLPGGWYTISIATGDAKPVVMKLFKQ